MRQNGSVRLIVSCFVFLAALGAQEVQLLVANAAKPYAALRDSRIVAGSLIDVSIAPTAQPQSFWFDTTQNISVVFQPRWFEETVDFQLLASPFPSTLRVRVPDGLAAGGGNLIVRVNGVDVGRAPVEIVGSDFGIFTISNGLGPAVALNIRSSGAESNGLTRPAKPGDHLTLWGTGLGTAGAAQVQALLDGTRVDVAYAGPAPGQPGLDQINLRIPESFAANSCYAPLHLSVGAQPANVVTISISRTGDPCVHPLGLSTRQMAAVDAGGTAPVGNIGVYTLIGPPPDPHRVRWDLVTRIDHADAGFFEVDAAGLWSQSSRSTASEPVGPCRSQSGGLGIAGWLTGGASISMGERVRISRGDRAMDLIPYNADFPTGYIGERPRAAPQTSPELLPQSFWTPGRWTIEAPGTATVGPLQSSIAIPPSLEITNVAAVKNIDRSKDLAVHWNAEGYTPDHLATISIRGSRTVLHNPFSATTGSHLVTCTVSAAAGTVTIAAALLTEFDPAEGSTQSSPSFSINLSGSRWIIDVPQKESDPIRTVVTFSSAEWFGISIR